MKNILSKIPNTIYVFLFFFTFFVLNLTSNFSGPHDSMGYLNDLQKGRDLFPAHHLLYHYMDFQILHFLRHIFWYTADYYLVEMIDTFWGCLGLAVLYKIFSHRMNMTSTESFFGTAVAAFSFGMWFYCSNIEVYMPPLFFLLFGLYLCMKNQLQSRDVLLLTFVHCLAVLFHQANVLFAPIVLWKFWDSRKNIPFIRSLLLYGLSSIVIVGGIYFIVGWWVDGHNNAKDFNTWIRGYTLQTDYWFPLSFSTLLKALVGWGHAFFGGHFIFRIKFLNSFMNRIFYYHSLDDEAYLVRNLSHGVAILLLMLTILVVVLMLFLLIRIIRHWKTLYAQHRRLLLPPLMFLVIYSCFFFFWMPENLEFWIPQSVVFWIFVLGLNKQLPPLPLLKEKNYLLYIILATLLFIINFGGSIHWMKDISNDSVFVKIQKVRSMATRLDIILLQDPWLLDDFLEQYTPSVILRVPTEAPQIQELNEKLKLCLAGGGKIYLFTEGGSMHSSKNRNFMDSLLQSNNGKFMDLQNPLTPVKVIRPQ
jgi:hypothetical protein